METLLLPVYANDDAKFKITQEELTIIKSKLENLRYCKQINGVFIRIAICAYENGGTDLLDGKLTFSSDVYFAIIELLK